MAAIGIFLLIVGAILRWGIDAVLDDVDLVAIGYIVMAGGALALAIAAIQGMGWMSMSRSSTKRERHVSADGQHVVEERRTT